MSEKDREALPKVRKASRESFESPGSVERPSRKSGMGQRPSRMSRKGLEALSEVREVFLVAREGSVGRPRR